MWGGPWPVRVFACAAALVAVGPARAAEIKNLRVWAGPEYTRAVFDVSGPTDYKLFELAKPDRIVLDLHASAFADTFGAPAAKGLLKGIRAGKQGKDDARIVFDLAEGVRPKSFLLPPADKFGYRLVLDLYPATEKPAPVKSVAEAAPGKPRDVVVAIDAGHGGDDPGATGSTGAHEKDITLAVARQLKKQIDKTPGMSAVLTRDGDYFVPLEKRYAKARDEKADLFVSIHADAFKTEDARGSSVWVLSPRGATNEASRWLADRENRADLVGGVSLDDKDDTLAAVLLDLSQGATMGASNAVAEQVLTVAAQARPDAPRLRRARELRRAALAGRAVDPGRDRVHHESVRGSASSRIRIIARSSPRRFSMASTDISARRRRPAASLRRMSMGRTKHVPLTSRYVVNRGDTLRTIAEHHGLSIAQLREANDLAEDRVRPGEVLQIPSG